MTSTDVLAPSSPPRLPIQQRKRPPRVHGKLATAIDLIVFDGADLQTAAAGAGLTTYTLRQAFGRPHVIAHLKSRRDVFRAAVNGQNILRLAQIRDAANNMPAVNAIKVLEQIADEQTNASPSHSPHLTIKIVQSAPDFPNQKDVSPTISTIPNSSSRDPGGEK